MNTIDLQIVLNNYTNSLKPESLDGALLSKIILAIDKVVCAANYENAKSAHEIPAIALTHVQDGSFKGIVKIGAWAANAAAGMLMLLSQDKASEVPMPCREPLNELQKLCRSNSLKMRFESGDAIRFEISETSPIVFPKYPVMTVKNASVHGILQTVGGEKPTANVKSFKTGKVVHIHLTQDLAIELGRLLYKRVGLVCVGKLDTVTHEYVHLEAVTLIKHNPNVLLSDALDSFNDSFATKETG